MKMKAILIVLVLALIGSAFAKDHDHSAEYKVGTLQSTEQIDTGTFTSCDHGCMSQSTGHNVHYVVNDDGAYVINAPTSAGLSFLQGMLVSPNLPDVHIQWFLDDLNVGDKVLFAAECDKHNNCHFWLPKPDQLGKEYHTTGLFRPRIAKTNTNQLCGTGKLTPAIEAQVCNQPPVSPAPAPVAAPVIVPTAVPITTAITPIAPVPTTTPELTNQEKASVRATPAELSDPRIARLKVMCEHGQIPVSMRAGSCDLYGFTYPDKK